MWTEADRMHSILADAQGGMGKDRDRGHMSWRSCSQTFKSVRAGVLWPFLGKQLKACSGFRLLLTSKGWLSSQSIENGRFIMASAS